MLRFLAVVLVAANLLFFGFTRGWFDGLGGLHALGDREPERLAAQVRPESILVTPMPASGAARAADASACLEGGPVAGADASFAEAALRGVLASGQWVDTRIESPNGFTTVVTHMYRVPRADPATAARLATLRLDPAGHAFSACPASAPAR